MATTGKIRQDVGARNPYAMIENLERKQIDWKKKSRGEIRHLFSKHFDMKFEEVFGSADSPIFRKVGEGAALSVCTDAANGYYPYPGWVYMSGASPGIDDSVQGCTPDCYYLASVCSLAWVNPSAIKRLTLNFPLTIPFYIPPHTVDNPGDQFLEDPQTVDSADLYLRKEDDVYTFVHARSTTPSNEIWPAIYEKAYAKFLGIPLVDGNADHPDISQIGQGSAFTVLQNLTKTRLVLDEQSSLTSSYNDGDAVYTKIQSSLCLGQKKAQRPAVSFTRQDLECDEDKLVANHAYSVLGVQTENNQKYGSVEFLNKNQK
ncbi:MAG: hypothetical protein A4E35_01774 [Methanoregula sp. PtaU1.Bin051]|nr:MAG: hypothetical protein A4E35_01774 [Methanoregula sp. PtaU1.Bin051]